MKRLRSKLKNLAVMALALCLFCALSIGNAEQSFDADAFMTSINGVYGELFSVITRPEYDSVWLERCTEYVGEEDAQAAMDYLTTVCCGDVYGEEAVKAYGGAPESAQFYCGFLGGVARLTFDNGTISGVDADGSEVFSHKYAYVGDSEQMGFHLYKTDDADAGAFTYFALRDDTPGNPITSSSAMATTSRRWIITSRASTPTGWRPASVRTMTTIWSTRSSICSARRT